MYSRAISFSRSSRSADFVHAALRVETLNRSSHVSARQLLDDGFERRILLPHDVVEPRRLDPRFLELLIGSAGVDGLVLTHIAHEQDAVVCVEPMQELVHLLRAGQTRFVEHVQPLLAVIAAPRFASDAAATCST